MIRKGAKVLKLVENWATMFNNASGEIDELGQRVWFVVNGELVTEKDLLYGECADIINWKLLHTNVDFGLVEISEGVYGE